MFFHQKLFSVDSQLRLGNLEDVSIKYIQKDIDATNKTIQLTIPNLSNYKYILFQFSCGLTSPTSGNIYMDYASFYLPINVFKELKILKAGDYGYASFYGCTLKYINNTTLELTGGNTNSGAGLKYLILI